MSEIESAIESFVSSEVESSITQHCLASEQYAEEYADSEIADLRGDLEDQIGELQSRIEALEEKAEAAAEPDLIQELVDSVEVKEEPRPVNQIDWVMTHHGLIAGYDSKSMLESYVRSLLPADYTHQAEMIIAMTLTTARNIINKKLEAES